MAAVTSLYYNFWKSVFDEIDSRRRVNTQEKKLDWQWNWGMKLIRKKYWIINRKIVVSYEIYRFRPPHIRYPPSIDPPNLNRFCFIKGREMQGCHSKVRPTSWTSVTMVRDVFHGSILHFLSAKHRMRWTEELCYCFT